MRISKDRMTLVGSDANGVYGDACTINGDVSLSALVRALSIKYGTFDENKPGAMVCKVRARGTGDMVEYTKKGYYDDFSVMVVECVGCIDNEIETTDDWTSTFTINGKAFPVNRYLSQFTKTRIYVNNERQRIIAFVDRTANHIWVQALESVLCRLMPWYFPSELPEEDKLFFKSIAVDNSEIKKEEAEEIFIRYVNDIAKGIDFRALKLAKMLHGIADKARSRRMATLKDEINRLRNEIDSYSKTIGERYVRLDSHILELNGLELIEPQEDDAMKKFFQSHKQVDILNVYDDSLEFAVNDTLEFYDEEEFERLLEKKTSYIHSWSNDILDMLKAIFLDKIGLIKTHAMFNLENFKLVRSLRDNCVVDDAMPNPHIYFYGCDGANGQYYRQYAESGDWDLGIEQAISATKNLNWGDSTVCERMINWMEDHLNTRCIYYNEGAVVENVTDETKLITIKEFMNNISKKAEDESSDG